MIFDTHAHYEDEAFDLDRSKLLETFPSQGIEYLVNIGSEVSSIDKIIALSKEYSYIYSAVGIHPSSTMDLNEEVFQWLKEKSYDDKVVAIGEIGLDYYWDTPDRSIQKEWFIRQMELARERKLPVIIHSRDAANDTYQLMKEAKAEEIGAIIHCFSYGVEQARQYLDMDFYLGVGGVLTFKNAKKLKEVVAFSPLERLVLETDAPYLSPEPNRGKRNVSTNLQYVAQEIARIKNVDYETVIRISNENAKRFYFNER